MVFAKTTKITQTPLEWSMLRGNVNHFKLWAGMGTDRTFGSKTAHLPLRHPRHHLHVPAPPVLLSPPLFRGAAISRSPGCDCQHPSALEPLFFQAVMPAESQNWWKTGICSWGSSSFPWSEGKSKRNFESPAQTRSDGWWLQCQKMLLHRCAAEQKPSTRGGRLDGRTKK